ncbi:unnamed protein product [Somion occarium]
MSAPSSTLVVHHLNDSRSQRILWLLEELDVPYELKKYQRMPDMTAPKELTAVHPLGYAPVITDGDITLAESGAIVEYIINKYGGGKANLPEAGKIDDLYYAHYAEGSLMPMLVNKLVYNIVPQRSPFILRPLVKIVFSTLQTKMLDPRLEKHAAFIEQHLSKDNRQWFAGGDGPTAADYQMSFPLETWCHRFPEVLGPNTKEYVKRIHQRPAYKKALEKGGKYTYAE